MTRSRADVRDWALAYIEAQQSNPKVDLDHPLWWAIERTHLPDTLDKAEDIWQFILEVLARSKSDQVLGILGAGPMEDLLDAWGEHFIDRIEDAARGDPAFRRLLLGVWESGTPDVWRRVLLAREGGSGNGP